MSEQVNALRLEVAVLRSALWSIAALCPDLPASWVLAIRAELGEVLGE